MMILYQEQSKPETKGILQLLSFASYLCERKMKKKYSSPAGNWTRVSSVTGLNTNHYTTGEIRMLNVMCPLLINNNLGLWKRTLCCRGKEVRCEQNKLPDHWKLVVQSSIWEWSSSRMDSSICSRITILHSSLQVTTITQEPSSPVLNVVPPPSLLNHPENLRRPFLHFDIFLHFTVLLFFFHLLPSLLEDRNPLDTELPSLTTIAPSREQNTTLTLYSWFLVVTFLLHEVGYFGMYIPYLIADHIPSLRKYKIQPVFSSCYYYFYHLLFY